MIDTQAREYLDRTFINGAAKKLSNSNILPVHLTLCALFFGCSVPIWIYFNRPKTAIFCLVLSGIFDVFDGALARETDAVSMRGAVLDIFCDRCVEVAVISGLYFTAPKDLQFLGFTMLASVLLCITSFLVVGIFEANSSVKSFNYSPGLMERSEAFIFFIAMILFPHWFMQLAVFFSSFVAYTGILRIIQFYRNAQNE